MSDPPRLLSPESSASEFERRILRAWADERPAAGAREAALAAVGLGPPAARALALAKLAKWTMLLLGIGAPVVVALYRAQARTVPLARVEAMSRDETTSIPTLEVLRAPPPVSSARSAAVRAQPHARIAPDTLPAEIAALDRARAALHGDPANARALVDAYDATFPRGALREEAMVVRIEALVAAGDADEARRRTAMFVASYPNSPHVLRLRRLLPEP
jgi:hypothetical protein